MRRPKRLAILADLLALVTAKHAALGTLNSDGHIRDERATRREYRRRRKTRPRSVFSCRLGPWDPRPVLGGKMTPWKARRFPAYVDAWVMS